MGDSYSSQSSGSHVCNYDEASQGTCTATAFRQLLLVYRLSHMWELRVRPPMAGGCT
jgi:hypothetical protein